MGGIMISLTRIVLIDGDRHCVVHCTDSRSIMESILRIHLRNPERTRVLDKKYQPNKSF